MNGYDVAHELRALPKARDSVLIAVSGLGSNDFYVQLAGVLALKWFDYEWLTTYTGQSIF